MIIWKYQRLIIFIWFICSGDYKLQLYRIGYNTWAGEYDGNATNFGVVGILIGAATCWYVGNAK